LLSAAGQFDNAIADASHATRHHTAMNWRTFFIRLEAAQAPPERAIIGVCQIAFQLPQRARRRRNSYAAGTLHL